MRQRVDAWIEGDPDADTRDHLRAATDDELQEWFADTLAFGTAGLRGPLRAGPNGMNTAVVVRTTAAIVSWLRERCLGGGTVVVGRDARHGSEKFATATAEVFAAAGFEVVLLPRPLPTPIVAFAVRHLGAVAGVQITASHNPAPDNGYKVYLSGGAQLIPPADREIEAAIAGVGPAATVPRTPVTPADDGLIDKYLERVRSLPIRVDRSVRIALTAMHGVGGATCVAALHAAGFDDVHVVTSQFEPDPDFPTAPFPNPEEPGTTDALLSLAANVEADIAIALDPDADRCAVGVPGPRGWRMLTGDETGALLADHLLSSAPPNSLVANTIVSSQLMSALALARGARYARTLTGFKWLVRAGDGLVYAYEEAIGHCVDPTFVRDKDGISAAVVVADLTAALRTRGTTLLDALDDLAVEFGVHAAAQVSKRVDDLADIAAVMTRVRADPPATLAGRAVTTVDHLAVRGPLRTDAVELVGDGIRVIVRPSGTEPKLKAYLEAIVPVARRATLPDDRAEAEAILGELGTFARGL
ncbi:phospho-sugar mutase [Rhodococcus sp. NPDC058521]|uniref:phospho-sugar mutase n=1 Tax=Rhodococcus sp. NPDC058521 TaxID=3346536 RepID=UPI003660DCD5